MERQNESNSILIQSTPREHRCFWLVDAIDNLLKWEFHVHK